MGRRRKRKPQHVEPVNKKRSSGKRYGKNHYSRILGIDVNHFKNIEKDAMSISVDENTILDALQNPSTGAQNIVQASEEAFRVNGAYFNSILHLSTLLTYDHFMYPLQEGMPDGNPDVQSYFHNQFEVAMFLDQYKIKAWGPKMTFKALIAGASYWFKLEGREGGGDGITFFELNNASCRISYFQDGVYRVQYDMQSITDDEIEEELLPPELIQAYNQFQTNSSGDQFEEERWYQISHDAFAITLDFNALIQEGVSLPLHVAAILDAIKMQNAKDLMADIEALDNAKLIHSKIPSDGNGDLLLDLPKINAFRGMIEETLPDGAGSIVNPFETNVITLGDKTGKDAKFALVDKINDNLHDSLGVNPLLFAQGTNSGEALRLSAEADAQWLYSTILPQLESYINYEMSLNTSHGLWRVKFVETNRLSKKESEASAREALTTAGTSRLEYNAIRGLTPIDVINLYKYEHMVMDIDSLMVPKRSGHTMSADDADNAGRPQMVNPSAGAERSRATN